MADQRNVPDFKLYELEALAEKEIKDAGRFVKNNRLDIERLIVEKHKLRIEAFYNLRRNWDTYGFINVSSKTIFIDADLMDDEYQDKKYRFTLTEELAHFLIHGAVFLQCSTIEARIKFERTLGEDIIVRMESQAKALASAILMPKRLFEPFVEKLAGEKRDSNGQILVDELAKALGATFDVNFKAAKRRLKNLGYHRAERLGLDLD